MTAVPFKPSKWTLLFLLLSAMMILMGGAAVAPALPLISKAFPDSSESLISLIITLPALAIALTGFFIGSLSDKFGKVRVLVASVAVFTITGSSGFYLNSIPAILAGRFILGMGIAGITCTTSSLIAYYYEGITRAKVLGYQAAAMGLGVLILETSGGLLAGISWRAAFLIYLIGIVILVGVLVTMREPACLKFETKLETPDQVFPVLPLLVAYITLFLGNMLFFLMPTKFPFLLANMDAVSVFGGNSALASGLFLGISGCASSLLGVLYGRIAWRFHRYTILTFTFIFFGIGLCSLGFATSLVTVAIGVICIGIGEGILMPTILNWIAAITPKQYLGRASGGFSVALNLGQFASTLAIVPVFAIAVTYSNAFVACGCVAFVFALPYLLALLKEKYGMTMVPTGSKQDV
ncbi:MAG TPA: MFS transporter [Methanospirillum sp.]|uniref:MFS transporter n=1 Tax=Methanospirillum sp. TaxID=45200 RepID=UPI002D040AD3|nr:MFS transporter [Methanospirillum sp.]HWQ64715.1 MFS transporter [Methanospirillum sp.]